MNLVNMGKEFHVLPYAGGLLDQKADFVLVLEHVLQWQAEREASERKRGGVQH